MYNIAVKISFFSELDGSVVIIEIDRKEISFRDIELFSHDPEGFLRKDQKTMMTPVDSSSETARCMIVRMPVIADIVCKGASETVQGIVVQMLKAQIYVIKESDVFFIIDEHVICHNIRRIG